MEAVVCRCVVEEVVSACFLVAAVFACMSRSSDCAKAGSHEMELLSVLNSTVSMDVAETRIME